MRARFLGGARAARVAAVVLTLAASGLFTPPPARADDAERRTNIEIAEEAIRGAVRDALQSFPATPGDVRLFPLGTHEIGPLVESILVEELASRGYAVEVASDAEAAALAETGEDTTAAEPSDEGAAADTTLSPAARRSLALKSLGKAEGAAGANGGEGDGEPAGELPRAKDAAQTGLSDPLVGRSLLSYRVTDFSFRYADIYRKLVIGPRRIRRLSKVDLHLRLCEEGGRRIVWSENVAHSVSDIIPYGAAKFAESTTFTFAQPERTSGGFSRIYEPLIVGGIVGGLVFLFYSNQSGG